MSMEKFRAFRRAFIHWSGWTAWLHWSGWKKIGSWQGWKKILFPHPAMVVVLSTVSAAGLIWVLFSGREQSWFAYPLYCGAFYALVTLTALLIKVIPKGKQVVEENPLLKKLTSDEEISFRIKLYFEQVLNFCYGAFKLISGIVHASPWIGADGLYNFIQGIIQLYQILRRRKVTSLTAQWKSYRQCGYMMILLHLTVTWLVFQMIHMGEHEAYPGYMIFATAAFTFYKLVSAFIDVAKDRKNKRPVDSAVRLLDLSQALYNLFVLQVALLWEFGGGDFASAKLMNSMTGGAVCLLVVCTGIYMLRRSRREMRKLEENTNG